MTDCEDKALRIVLFMLTDQQVAVRARVLHSQLGQALLNPGKRETERLLTCVQVVAVISQGEGSVKADAPTESQAGTHKTRTEQAATWSYTSTGATVSHYTNTSFPFIV